VLFQTSVAWAGAQFSYRAGEVIDMTGAEDVANARIAAGLGQQVSSGPASPWYPAPTWSQYQQLYADHPRPWFGPGNPPQGWRSPTATEAALKQKYG
jgi:hypothetical protein